MPTTSGMSETVQRVIEASEWVSIATAGPDGPHLAATWGEYVRALRVTDQEIIIPAGGLHRTERNLGHDPRLQLLFASRRVEGAHGPGQGCLISGTGEIRVAGPVVERVRARFPWARGALVVTVREATTQL